MLIGLMLVKEIKVVKIIELFNVIIIERLFFVFKILVVCFC